MSTDAQELVHKICVVAVAQQKFAQNEYLAVVVSGQTPKSTFELCSATSVYTFRPNQDSVETLKTAVSLTASQGASQGRG